MKEISVLETKLDFFISQLIQSNFTLVKVDDNSMKQTSIHTT